jgi:hypothetical protein
MPSPKTPTKRPPAAPNPYVGIILELDKTIEKLRLIWKESKGEVRQALNRGIDGLLDERLRLMNLRDNSQ